MITGADPSPAANQLTSESCSAQWGGRDSETSDRQTDRHQTDRQTGRQVDRQTDILTNSKTNDDENKPHMDLLKASEREV